MVEFIKKNKKIILSSPIFIGISNLNNNIFGESNENPSRKSGGCCTNCKKDDKNKTTETSNQNQTVEETPNKNPLKDQNQEKEKEENKNDEEKEENKNDEEKEENKNDEEKEENKNDEEKEENKDDEEKEKNKDDEKSLEFDNITAKLVDNYVQFYIGNNNFAKSKEKFKDNFNKDNIINLELDFKFIGDYCDDGKFEFTTSTLDSIIKAKIKTNNIFKDYHFVYFEYILEKSTLSYCYCIEKEEFYNIFTHEEEDYYFLQKDKLKNNSCNYGICNNGNFCHFKSENNIVKINENKYNKELNNYLDGKGEDEGEDEGEGEEEEEDEGKEEEEEE